MPATHLEQHHQASGWVVQEDRPVSESVYQTQAEAVAAARKRARKSQAGVFVHGKDGKIKNR